jgi:Tol biopolymer transport system component
VINSVERDAEPTFSADGSTMYFNCFGRPGRSNNDICVTRRSRGVWSEPTVVESVSTREYDEVEPLLSPDGTHLYIMSDRPGGLGGPDIWVSEWVDDDWSEPVNLGAPINSPFADHCLYFAGPDWGVAFWTSTRPGGFGGNDIWTAERVDGVWQPAVNLGPNVNSASTEHHSLPSPDGRSLYVTSLRPDGFGREDIYVTTRGPNGVWGPLVNLGSAVNSEGNDRCPAFSPDNSTFYFDSDRIGGEGDKDLWSVPYEAVVGIR